MGIDLNTIEEENEGEAVEHPTALQPPQTHPYHHLQPHHPPPPQPVSGGVGSSSSGASRPVCLELWHACAMNALVRTSDIMSNGPFILNLDCDHYIYNSLALREGMCFMLDRGGDRICYVQFPQRFEGIDPSDRYMQTTT